MGFLKNLFVGENNKGIENKGTTVSMGTLMEESLGKYWHLDPSNEYSNPESNCVQLGFWSHPFLLIANKISGDPKIIISLLSTPAEKLIPYAKNLNLSQKILMHGYNSILNQIEKLYSTEAANAYKLGFLLGDVSNPNPKFRTQEGYRTFSSEIKKNGLSHIMESLDKAISSNKKESLVMVGALSMVAIAEAFKAKSPQR